MDRVRLGRVLGFGARQAVKTLVTAVDAATAEDPSARRTQSAQTRATATTPASPSRAAGEAARENPNASRAASPVTAKAAHKAAKTVTQVRGVRRGVRRFGEAVWNPFVRLSGVLWLEVTGVFFGIFALFAGGAAWRMRGDWHTSGDGRRSLLGAIAMLAVFGYFCVSSFVRARRRERGR